MPDLPEVTTGRNEPCPCGSKKKYKRCHGVDAAPKITPPRAQPAAASGVPGFDPSKVDPAAMSQMTSLMQRLPRAQLQKIQALMQKAMSGKDVTQEAQELERMMPPELLSQMAAFAPGLMGGMPAEFQAGVAAAEQDDAAEMSAAEARKVIEAAVKDGSLSRADADAALAARGQGASEPKTGRWSKLMGSFKK